MNITISSAQNFSVSEHIDTDLFIAAISGDARSTYLLSMQENNRFARWLIASEDILLNSSTQTVVPNNIEYVSTSNFQRLLQTWATSKSDDVLKILVDISSMPRPTMAAIFSGILNLAQFRRISLSLEYVIAAFSPPPTNLPPNEDIRPISEEFAGWPSLPAASTSLIVGLGYEREKAEGACEYFDPNETWVFVPKSPIKEYDEAVTFNNEVLISRANRNRKEQNYYVNNPSQTFGQLASLVSAISKRDNPVLLPFGPKIFFALALLVAAINPELGVWYVTGDSSVEAPEFQATQHLIGVRFEIEPKVSA